MTIFRQINGVTVPLKSDTNHCFRDVESYTKKTKCSICGEGIFFHQAENGGKVSFDKLGSPWDVHGCFQKKEIKTKTNLRSNQKPACINQFTESSKALGLTFLGFNSKQNLSFPIPKDLREKFLRYHNDAPILIEVVKKDDFYELTLDTYLQVRNSQRADDFSIEKVNIKYALSIENYRKYCHKLHQKSLAKRTKSIVASRI